MGCVDACSGASLVDVDDMGRIGPVLRLWNRPGYARKQLLARFVTVYPARVICGVRSTRARFRALPRAGRIELVVSRWWQGYEGIGTGSHGRPATVGLAEEGVVGL